MSSLKRSLAAGITLVELLIVIAIFLVLLVLTTRTFSSANANKALDTETQHVVAELNRARSLTLASKNKRAYGVHFATTSLTTYVGPTYEVGSSTNDVILLNGSVQIASTSFAGGGSKVLFERLTGETANVGTIIISLVSNASSTRTVTIYGTGLVETPQ